MRPKTIIESIAYLVMKIGELAEQITYIYVEGIGTLKERCEHGEYTKAAASKIPDIVDAIDWIWAYIKRDLIEAEIIDNKEEAIDAEKT